MKRITIWLFIIILVFGFGVTATLLYLKFGKSNPQNSETVRNAVLVSSENTSEHLPILSYCEIANNPEKYNEKTVRVRAKLSMGLEGSWFSDINCGVDNAAIVESHSEEIWLSIEQERKRGKNLNSEVELIAVGNFSNTIYNEGGLITPFKFEILRIEKVSD